MFSRPVSSGWKPVPTSRSDATRPRISTRPSVGAVIRERIFNNVLLPAPFGPMMPTICPRSTSKDTCRNAQTGTFGVRRRVRPLRGCRRAFAITSRSIDGAPEEGPPIRYSLPRF